MTNEVTVNVSCYRMLYNEICVACNFGGSQDILNNLEPSGPGDLDDNDLMLDVDLPEDGLHGQYTHSHTVLYALAAIPYNI